MSEANSKFPLWAILLLYEKANNLDMYGTVFDNFRLLVTWLNPDCEILNSYAPKKLTKLENSYQLEELAAILNIEPSSLFTYYNLVINNASHLYSDSQLELKY